MDEEEAEGEEEGAGLEVEGETEGDGEATPAGLASPATVCGVFAHPVTRVATARARIVRRIVVNLFCDLGRSHDAMRLPAARFGIQHHG
ncbi:hypothetical protein [Actinoplanes hulinensis]|uniref:hypothetical protein n=1 Tax=Actinoplanes hulinensis TaxID=1144547 RepID=UPI001C67D38F|nr:hypothetical protein [Actinoplanes hulinensis]